MGPLLSVEEVKYTEREIIKHVQRLLFPDVIKAMQRISSSKLPRQVASELKSLKIPAYMRKCHPFVDDVGVLRVGGRLENALIKYEAKHPIEGFGGKRALGILRKCELCQNHSKFCMQFCLGALNNVLHVFSLKLASFSKYYGCKKPVKIGRAHV